MQQLEDIAPVPVRIEQIRAGKAFTMTLKPESQGMRKVLEALLVGQAVIIYRLEDQVVRLTVRSDFFDSFNVLAGPHLGEVESVTYD